MIIEASAQHPTLRHARDPIFESVRRWSGQEAPTEQLSVNSPVEKMDEAGIDKTLISAWVAPRKMRLTDSR